MTMGQAPVSSNTGTPDGLTRSVGQPARSDVRLIARDDFDRNVWCILGAPIDLADVSSTVTTLEAAVRDGERLSFVTPNVNYLVRALKDKKARRQIIDADLSIADGAPLVAMAKLLGAPIRERAAGSDLLDALRQRPALGRKLTVFFFGGREGSAESAFETVNREPGGMEAVGWMNPGFGDVETMSKPEIIAEINAANPDFIVVSLGGAKGQDWIEQNQEHLNAAAIAHLGAAVDFTAGAIERAPRWMAKSGLEWAWRIKADRGLWKRYFNDGASLLLIAAQRLPKLMAAARTFKKRAEVAVDLSRNADRVLIRLSGDLTRDNLDPIRKTFREAAKHEADVRLDLAGADRIDTAFLGQVLMLEKHLTRSGNSIELINPKPGAIRLFTANAMDYRIVDDFALKTGVHDPQKAAAS